MKQSGHVASPVIIRPAVPHDVAAIEEIERFSFAHAGERFGHRRISYLISSARTLVRVAQAGLQVIGWGAGVIGLPSNRRWGRIYAMAVHPDAQGLKIGPKLLTELLADLRNRGAGSIFLEVRSDNHAALKLYQRFGFKPCKDLPNYYGQGTMATRMVLASPD